MANGCTLAIDKVTFAGGKKIGRFVLTARPFLQPLGHMTQRDLEEEGGMQHAAGVLRPHRHPPDTWRLPWLKVAQVR